MRQFACVLVILALLLIAQISDAHKSVRRKRILSDLESEAIHQQAHLDKVKVKNPHLADAEHHEAHRNGNQEKPTRLVKSKAYHFAYGPEYPSHDQSDDGHTYEERMHEGHPIPDFISTDEFRENFK